MTPDGTPAPDPTDPDRYHRGDRWPSETLRPLVLTPDELNDLRLGLDVVVTLAWGDLS